MMEKFLRIIRGYPENDFQAFIQKVGLGEFSENFLENNIKAPSLVLDLDELKLFKWKLPMSSRKKILSRIEDIKKNPEKYLIYPESSKTEKIERKHSFVHASRMHFRQELETVISPNMVPDPKPIIKPKPTLKKVENLNEYLDMTQTNFHEDDGDDDGYLTPTILSEELDDDTYEPPPSVGAVLLINGMGKRPPMPLPQEKTDYINGDYNRDEEDLPPLLPRSHQINNSLRSRNNASKFDDEDDKNKTPISGTSSNDLEGKGSKSSGFFPLFRWTKKNQTPNLKENPDEIPEKEKPDERININAANPQRRPLPALPKEQSEVNCASFIVQSDLPKSQSGISVDPKAYYDNIPHSKIPSNQSYQHHYIKKLPVPPLNLPTTDGNDFLSISRSEQQSRLENLNNNPYYRNTDRKGARLLLSGLSDGAFLIRPSKKFFLTLSLIYRERDFHLGIIKTSNNNFCLNTEGEDTSPLFSTLIEFIQHFSRHAVTFRHEEELIELILKKELPEDKY